MKKLQFAIQVFGLMAILPLAVVLEMNHVKGDPSNSYNSSSLIKAPEKTDTVFLKEAKVNSDHLSGTAPQAMFIKLAF